eukprot:symbB.v1.2.011801.t1/scaffold773.1/size166002/10
MSVKANLAWQDGIVRENRCRRSYWLGRFGSSAILKMGDDGIYDPYNNPQADVHRAVAIPEIAGYKSWEKFRGKKVARPESVISEGAPTNQGNASCKALEVSESREPSRLSTRRSSRSRSSRSVASLRTAIGEAVELELARAGLASVK